MFGIALFRAGILARWAAALLAVAAVATMAIPLLPMVNQRLFAVPNGIAMIGLGWSLWREQRSAAAEPVDQLHERAARPGRRPVTLHTAARPTRSARPTGWVPFALVALVVLPAVAGSLRLVELAGGPLLLPANPRMTASPLPVVVHITCAVPYAVLGAFQFSSRLRRRQPRWHRAAGQRRRRRSAWRWRSPALWMTVFYPRQPGTGELALLFRLAFGSALAACIVLGFSAIRRGDVTTHRAWMTRAYAIALAAGTQTVTLGIGSAVFGTSVLITDLALGAAWVVNLAVAELVIRRCGRPTGPARDRPRWVRRDRASWPTRRRSPTCCGSAATWTRTGQPRSAAWPWPTTDGRHHHAHRCRRRPGRAARHPHPDPRPGGHAHLAGHADRADRVSDLTSTGRAALLRPTRPERGCSNTSSVAVDRFMVMKWMPGAPSSSIR